MNTLPESSSKKRIVVRMAEHGVSQQTEEELATYSLGSCLAVALYDPEVHVGSMAHILLPNSSIDPKKAIHMPYLFMDTGLPLLFKEMCELGAKKARLQIKLAGGADMIVSHQVFNVGERNYQAATKYLQDHSLELTGESIGGHCSRSFRLNLATGKAFVEMPGKESIVL